MGHSAINPKLDPDTTFFESISSFGADYLTANKTKIFVGNIYSESFIVLYLNIRDIKKTLKVLKNSSRI